SRGSRHHLSQLCRFPSKHCQPNHLQQTAETTGSDLQFYAHSNGLRQKRNDRAAPERHLNPLWPIQSAAGTAVFEIRCHRQTLSAHALHQSQLLSAIESVPEAAHGFSHAPKLRLQYAGKSGGIYQPPAHSSCQEISSVYFEWS